MRGSHQLAALGVFVVACAAQADIVIGNFGAAVGTGTVFGTASTTIYKAAGFTMPGQAYDLTRVTLSMNFGGGGTGIVSIWTGSATPQTRVAELTGPPQTGSGEFSFAPTTPLRLEAGQTYWVYVESIPSPVGNFLWDGTSPSTLPTGVATFVNYIFNGNPSTFRNRFQVEGTPAGAPCYANCDGSTGTPALNVNDFVCFQSRFAAADPYADCDQSTTLNVNDFVCFQSAFAAGCP